MELIDTTVVDTLTKALDTATVADSVAAVVDTAKTAVDSAAVAVANAELTTSGIIFMSASWLAIIALCIFCFAKVLGGKDKK